MSSARVRGCSSVLAALLTVLSIWEVRRFGRDRLEYDFSRLRRRDTWVSGEGYWGKRMDTLLGRYLTPTAILTDSEAEARAVTARLRAAAEHPPLASMIASIRTYDDVVPPDEAAKQAELADDPAQDDPERSRQHQRGGPARSSIA